MPTVSAGGESNYELAEVGAYTARCIRVVDLGTQINDYNKEDIKDVRKVMITWEISELMEDGRPFVVNKHYTLSIGDKSNLGKALVSWRAKAFTEEEKNSFDLKNILDVTCLLSVTVTKDEKYNDIGSIMPVPKGMEVNDRVNKLFLFDVEDLDNSDQTDNLWPFEKFFLKMSKEYKATGSSVLEKKDNDSQDVELDEDPPF